MMYWCIEFDAFVVLMLSKLTGGLYGTMCLVLLLIMFTLSHERIKFFTGKMPCKIFKRRTFFIP